jgi:hypothetical protein
VSVRDGRWGSAPPDVIGLPEGNPPGAERPEGRQGNRSRAPGRRRAAVLLAGRVRATADDDQSSRRQGRPGHPTLPPPPRYGATEPTASFYPDWDTAPANLRDCGERSGPLTRSVHPVAPQTRDRATAHHKRAAERTDPPAARPSGRRRQRDRNEPEPARRATPRRLRAPAVNDGISNPVGPRRARLVAGYSPVARGTPRPPTCAIAAGDPARLRDQCPPSRRKRASEPLRHKRAAETRDPPAARPPGRRIRHRSSPLAESRPPAGRRRSEPAAHAVVTTTSGTAPPAAARGEQPSTPAPRGPAAARGEQPSTPSTRGPARPAGPAKEQPCRWPVQGRLP